jgi:hypothetical protein
MNRYFRFLVLVAAIMISGPETTLRAQVPDSLPTSYEKLSSIVAALDKESALISTEIIGNSAEGRSLFVMKFSSGEFGKDPSKIRILIFAQQHGNEQSGKEGALLLAKVLAQPEYRYLFDRVDLAIVPQMNPDGSEANKRRNGNDADLNRNHLILTQPETQALHKLFDQYLFEVTMDVHEYWPFGDTWKDYGYRNNSDILIGTTTNTNVSEKIRKLSNNDYLPFIKKFLDKRHVSNFIYSPGGPPEIDYIRHSTFDINDGRQSLGIQNSFSFIQEGMNGFDDFRDNITHRAFSQMSGMLGLIEYSYQNKKEIKKLVENERESLVNSKGGEKISIQSVHISNGKILSLPVYSYYTGNDSVINVKDYRPVVSSLSDVIKPSGYLISMKDTVLTEWLERQALITEPYAPSQTNIIEQYFINKVDSIDFEGDIVSDPRTTESVISPFSISGDYLFVTVSQLKGNLLVIALEPKSMLGLVTYPQFSFLLKKGENFPVLRVIRK